MGHDILIGLIAFIKCSDSHSRWKWRAD